MATKRAVWLAECFSARGVSVKGLSLEHPCCLLVRSRFLSGHSGVLQFTAATEFDNFEAASFLHALEIGNQPLLASERERGDWGVY